MKILSIIGLVLAAIALAVSVKTNCKKPDTSASDAKIKELTAQVNELEAVIEDQATDIDELNIEIAAIESTMQPSVPIDQVKDLVRTEMQEQMTQWRGRQRGGQGGQAGAAGVPTTPEEQKAWLKDNAGIEGEKAETVIASMTELRDTIRGIWRDNKGGSRDANVELMRLETEKADQKLVGVLSAEELTKLKAARDQLLNPQRRREGQGQDGQPVPPPAPPAPAEQNF
jgi:outer membrane murein-binding lipoprotein Lpp